MGRRGGSVDGPRASQRRSCVADPATRRESTRCVALPRGASEGSGASPASLYGAQMSAPPYVRTYVVIDLGWPIVSRRTYRGLGTVRAPDRRHAHALAETRELWRGARWPVRILSPSV